MEDRREPSLLPGEWQALANLAPARPPDGLATMTSHGTGRMLVLLILLHVVPVRAADAQPPTDEQAHFFETKIRPVLVDSCLKCHGPDKPKSNLRLDSRAAALAGGDQGAAVVP